MKRAIIIGATSGIGRELAKLIANNDYIVGITGRRTELLQELKAEKPDVYLIKTIDVQDCEATLEKLEQLTKEMGGLDLLIFSSGVGDLNNDLDFEIERQTINTNIIGFTSIANWAFGLFEKQEHGHFATITSIAGLRGSRQAPAYNATKAYQINYLEGLRQKASKVKGHIAITDVRPGFVRTDMAKGHGLFWVASVNKASHQIWNALKKKRKVVYVTKRWCIIALILKLIPRSIYNLI